MADDESWLYGEEDDKKDALPMDEGDSVKEEAPPTPPEENEDGQEQPPQDDDDENDKESPPSEGLNEEDKRSEEESSKPTEGDEEEQPATADEESENVRPSEDPEDEEDDDSDDDGFRITIDQNKIEEAKSSYSNAGGATFGVKSRPALTEKKGKFSVEEMDQVGNVNGLPAHELDMESLEEKPWKKPGADITDYFNYGFTEETWQAYCNRQRKMRVGESGVGMPGLNNTIVTSKGGLPLGGSGGGSLIMSNNNNSSQSNSIPTLGGSNNSSISSGGAGKAPPGVIAPPGLRPTPPTPLAPSSIAVMTHDKREYSKKVISEIDFSVPPPGMGGGIPTVGGGGPPTNVNLPPPPIPPPSAGAGGAGPPPFPGEDPFDSYHHSSYYEPTMEAQWTAPPGDRDYDDRNSDWGRSRRTRDDRRDYERKRRRSRSRSRDRYRERRERRRSRSKSPSYSKHKKSKKEKKERVKEESSSGSSIKREEDRVD